MKINIDPCAELYGHPMKKLTSILFCLLLAASTSTTSASVNENWHDDINKAIAASKENGKDLLLLYTGSDWCPPCKQLESEVLGQEEFLNEAKNNFEFVIFDFPKQKQLSEATQKQNREWASKFGVEGYPTVILVDSKLRPYAITGYRDGGVENYLGMLGEFHQARIRRDEAFAKAEKLTGPERAKALDAGLSEMETELASIYYEDMIKEIVDIDKEDELALRTKWNASKDSENRKVIMTDIVVVSRLKKPELAIQFIDEVLEEIKFPAIQKLQIYQIKLNLLRKINDLPAMDAMLDQMIGMEELTNETRQRLMVKKVFFMVGTDRQDGGQKYLNESLEKLGSRSGLLWLAHGELLVSDSKFKQAIDSFDTGIKNANGDPDVLIDLFGAKADAHMSLENELEAIRTLDAFADNKGMPSDLRSEAMLQKAMIMRDSGRSRRATLVENRAVEIAESPSERAETQKLVERLRKRFGT